MKKPIAAVVFVALVALAGCSAVTGPSETANADLPNVTEQSWADADGQVNYTQLFEQHRTALSNASSYTFNQRIASNTGSTTNTRIAVDHGAERANLTISTVQRGTEERQETFVANGSVYAKSVAGNETQYSSSDQNLTGAAFDRFSRDLTTIQVRGGVLPALDFEHTGIENGAYVFEADSISASEETSFDAENVTQATSRLAIAPSGYVSELTLTLVVEQTDGEQRAEATVRTEGVNSTTVTEPAWTDEAAAA